MKNILILASLLLSIEAMTLEGKSWWKKATSNVTKTVSTVGEGVKKGAEDVWSTLSSSTVQKKWTFINETDVPVYVILQGPKRKGKETEEKSFVANPGKSEPRDIGVGTGSEALHDVYVYETAQNNVGGTTYWKSTGKIVAQLQPPAGSDVICGSGRDCTVTYKKSGALESKAGDYN